MSRVKSHFKINALAVVLTALSIPFLIASLAVPGGGKGALQTPREKVSFTSLGEREVSGSVPGAGDTAVGTTGGGNAKGETVSLTARFPAGTEEVSGIFKRSLPDSGVVPVAVTVMNETDTTVVIHTASGLGLGGDFDGFSLITGGNAYLPVHPMEALMRALAAEKGVAYRKPGFWGLTLGILVAPPLAVYFAYNEIVSGRFYRPIFNNSLYPSLPDWTMNPIVVEPGGEVEGFLYFVLPPAENPYPLAGSIADDSTTVDSMAAEVVPSEAGTADAASRGLSFELRLKACVRQGRVDTIGLDELLLVRDEGGGLNDGRGHFVALRRDGSSRKKRTLVFGEVRDLGLEPIDSFQEAAEIRAKSATIADASAVGNRTACALNFKAKSKVYCIQQQDGGVSVASRGFDRNLMRIFAIDDGLLVITENGFCHSLSGDKLKERRRVNFPRGVEDAAVFDGRLHVLHRDGTLDVYGLSGDDLLEEIDRYDLTKGKARIVGRCREELALLHEGSRIAGDTLFIVDAEDMGAAALLMVPGRVVYASCSGAKAVLQLENGTVLFLALGGEESYAIEDVFYVAFPLKTFHRDGDEIIAVGAEGAFLRGRAEQFRPGAAGTYEASAAVELPVIQ